jgi:hypothetical protein
MSFKNLSDQALEDETLRTVAEKNRIDTRLLHLLCEIERRKLYSLTSPLLFEYCVKVLKLSASSAQRRIDTMRAMKIIPEIEEKLLSGDLNLSSVAQAQSFFRQESKLGKKYSVTQKREVLSKLENKSSRECMRELVMISPEAIPQERRRFLDANKTELKIVVDRELLEKLDELKALWSHINPNMSDLELLKKMIDQCLKKPKPRKVSLPTSVVRARHIPAHVKREVRARDKNTCTHPGCKSKHQLEFDHIIPISMGGKSTTENLRMLCKTHNQRAAIEKLGFKKMNTYINKPASQ